MPESSHIRQCRGKRIGFVKKTRKCDSHASPFSRVRRFGKTSRTAPYVSLGDTVVLI
jgi:hypothetical protein